MSAGLITNSTMLFFMILLLGAMAGYFSERVGIANISINGQMIFGALVFTIFAQILQPRLGNESFALPMILSMFLTILASSLFGFLTIKLKANQIVAGTAINLLTAGLATFITEPLGPVLSGGTQPKLNSQYTSLGLINNSGIFITTICLLLVVVLLVIGLWALMKYTPFGLRLRAIGANPNAVDAQGINVIKYQWISLTISGMLAGLAGSIYMFQNTGFFNGNVSGLGFLSLAILIAGSWRIPLIFAVSIVFAAISKIFEHNKETIPTNIGHMIPFAITLLGLVFFSKYNVAPRNIGIPFDKSLR